MRSRPMPECHQIVLRRRRALRAQREVVLDRAAVVAVALDLDARRWNDLSATLRSPAGSVARSRRARTSRSRSGCRAADRCRQLPSRPCCASARLPPPSARSEMPPFAPAPPCPSSSLPFFLLEQPAVARAMTATTTTPADPPPLHHHPLQPATVTVTRASPTRMDCYHRHFPPSIRLGSHQPRSLRYSFDGAAARRAEDQIATVRRPARILVAAGTAGDLADVAAVGLHREDLEAPADARRVGDAVALRRPARRGVVVAGRADAPRQRRPPRS